ncbi:MAG: hypothetical protein ACD_79C00469G0003 [uncultured bacterium]|nr:MAG: hypothetical protein ACD_79C00469G0003 [uncultured bacterium]
MKLKKEKWEKVTFQKLVFNISERVEPNDTTLNKYIGLEHIDSGSCKIQRCGTPEAKDFATELTSHNVCNYKR